MRILTHRKTAGIRNRKRHGITAEREHVHVTAGDQVRVMRAVSLAQRGQLDPHLGESHFRVEDR